MKITDIPWDRLATFYGRANEVPKMIQTLSAGQASHRQEACTWLEKHLEHQDGVCQTTPLAVYFILEALEGGRVTDAGRVVAMLRRFLHACHFQLSLELDLTDCRLEDLLLPEHLWPEYVDEDTDEIIWEQELGPGDALSRAWPRLTTDLIRSKRPLFCAFAAAGVQDAALLVDEIDRPSY